MSSRSSFPQDRLPGGDRRAADAAVLAEPAGHQRGQGSAKGSPGRQAGPAPRAVSSQPGAARPDRSHQRDDQAGHAWACGAWRPNILWEKANDYQDEEGLDQPRRHARTRSPRSSRTSLTSGATRHGTSPTTARSNSTTIASATAGSLRASTSSRKASSTTSGSRGCCGTWAGSSAAENRQGRRE